MEQNPHDLLSETRTAMEDIAAKMLSLKREGLNQKKPDVLRGLLTDMALLLVSLRQANRVILVEEDRAKAETEKARAPVDSTTLQLHNLVYEKNHYLKAIKACKDFRSRYPDIDLVPESEFLAHAPDHIKSPLPAANAPHDLMLKRLDYELFQRKELCKLKENLEQRKKQLSETIATRKKFLSSLPSHLKSLKKASLPVQQQLGMPHTKRAKQNRAAELLPPPLYIVYTQLFSQKEAFHENIELEILGSMKDAQAYAVQQSNKDTTASENVESSRMEEETPDDDDDGQRRRKRPKKLPGKDAMDEAHPLTVVVHVFDEGRSGGGCSKLLTLRFGYLVKLNVVCVGIDGAEEGPENSLLCNLFPDDTGLQLPHTTAKLYSGDSLLFDEKRMSRPYKWAQHLAGMDFLPEIAPLLASENSSDEELPKGAAFLSGLALYRRQNRVETLLKRIRSRAKVRLSLLEQLDSLAKLRWPSLASAEVPWASKVPSCVLERWSEVKHEMELGSSGSDQSAAGQAMETSDQNVRERAMTLKDGIDSATEDGELPSAIQVPASAEEQTISTPSKLSLILERSRNFSLIAKSSASTPRSLKNEDDLELMQESESEDEKQDLELEEACDNSIGDSRDRNWEKYGLREFELVLSRTDKSTKMKLVAKVAISIEYPLRPPSFSLDFSNGEPEDKDSLRWCNELRAMEAEVNLHILTILPEDHEKEVFAHQVRYLGMLFDLHFDQSCKFLECVKSSSVMDVGLSKPVSGKMIARSYRGRDRRKMLSWKKTGCAPGYPC